MYDGPFLIRILNENIGGYQRLNATVRKSPESAPDYVCEASPLQFYQRMRDIGREAGNRGVKVTYRHIAQPQQEVISVFFRHAVPEGKLEEIIEEETPSIFSK